MRIYVNRGSVGSFRLNKALGLGQRVGKSARFLNKYNHTILNWGCSRYPDFRVEKWINNPLNVKLASDKLHAMNCLYEEDVIPWTTDKSVAESWGTSVVERHSLTGHSGKGIRVVHHGEEIRDARLYTLYIPKRLEFRVHCTPSKVIDITQKKRESNVVQNDNVRNRKNGWIYARQDIRVYEGIEEIGMRAVESLGLDFGAVDVIRESGTGRLFVLEVNTAPGLEGTTLDKYVEFFRNL